MKNLMDLIMKNESNRSDNEESNDKFVNDESES